MMGEQLCAAPLMVAVGETSTRTHATLRLVAFQPDTRNVQRTSLCHPRQRLENLAHKRTAAAAAVRYDEQFLSRTASCLSSHLRREISLGANSSPTDRRVERCTLVSCSVS
ncbi:hypothetical protein Hypma_002748 [Hypsizygus marmoreus]|uniref:Uncharacterized protein n=1 Tax=Hypsizygus marmoreus TaxID=39966 RepID=A0A369J5A5_HYPMA|nr:hypothetical protein Hypma_002748 [Hypsizygus marmoreus]